MHSFVHSVSVHRNREIAWSPPTCNFVKVNADDSSYGKVNATNFVGGILRKNCGEWITGFVGLASDLYAELLAIFNGL